MICQSVQYWVGWVSSPCGSIYVGVTIAEMVIVVRTIPLPQSPLLPPYISTHIILVTSILPNLQIEHPLLIVILLFVFLGQVKSEHKTYTGL